MAYVTVTNTTATTATVLVSGMNTSYPYKQIAFMICLASESELRTDYIVGADDYGYYCGDGTYEYTYTGLDPDTAYFYRVSIGYRTSIGHFEEEEWGIDGNFTTESGGSTDNPSYYYDYTDGNDYVTIYVSNSSGYYIRYTLEDDAGNSIFDSDDYFRTQNTSQVISNLVSGTKYWIRVGYSSTRTGSVTWMDGPTGGTWTSFTATGGGGGGWHLYEESAGTVSSSFDFPYNNGFEGMTLYRMSITFSQNVTVTFSTSGSADTIGWLSEYNQTTWDSTTGRPDNYVASDDDSGDGSNFEFSYTCTAGYVYYLWYRTYGESGFVGNTITLSVNIEGGGVTPSYTASVVNSNQIAFSVSDAGSYYFRYFVRLTSVTSNVTYDTWQLYNHLTSDTSLTVTDLSYNTSYTVNVGYSTDYYDGNVTWIGSQVLTTQDAPYTGWEEIYVGDVNVTTTDRSLNRSLAMKKTYRYNVRFSTQGTVRIYSTGATSSSDVVAYWGTSSNGIDTSNGVPATYNDRWDDDGSDRNFNSGEITVAANTAYYLWVKCYRDDTTAQITIYITAPVSDTGKVWIYTGSSWIQATPYIYNGSSWVKVTPYVYTSSGWRKCT